MPTFARFAVALALASSLIHAGCGGTSLKKNVGTGTGGSAGGAAGAGTGGTSGSAGTLACESTPAAVLCVRGTPEGENERLAVGDRLRVELNPFGCHSSSCTEAVIAACSVERSASDFVVDGEFCLASSADSGVACTEDCGGGGVAQCESDEPLEAGSYAVILGDLSVSFTVPGTLSIGTACDGERR